MSRLALDDPRWLELGTRSPMDKPVASLLEQLLKAPDDVATFRDLWPYLCSEDTAWPAAYAALPFIVDVAEVLAPKSREEHLFFAGYVAMCTRRSPVPSALRDEYEKALVRALALYPATFIQISGTHAIRHALGAMAALKGHHQLGDLINNLDCGCPNCGGELLAEG